MNVELPEDPRMHAALELLRRTGQLEFQLRYSDDTQPIIWIAVGRWSIGDDGRPVADGGDEHYETASSTNPVQAVLRLLENMVDGGMCANCERPTGVLFPEDNRPPILRDAVCWFTFDADSKRFVSDCRREAAT